MNFKFPVGIFAVFSVFVLMFSACGDDSGNSASDELPESVEQFSDIKNIECNADRECTQIYIEEHDDYVQCIDSKWETVIASKPNKACADAKSSSSKNKSSSSKGKLSSGSKEKGSDESEYDSQKNTLTDYRDGKIYKTATIGSQIWMAENLNYEYDPGSNKSLCYNNSLDSCAKYGRLYSWSAAMDADTLFSKQGKYCYSQNSNCKAQGRIRGVCPSGWYLPRTEDWETLFAAVGGAENAGAKLKSSNGWNGFDGRSGDGSNAYGFSAIPAGFGYSKDDFRYIGNSTYFWSSTRFGLYDSYIMYLGHYYEGAFVNYEDVGKALSVRCLKYTDEDAVPKSTKSSSSVKSSSSKKNFVDGKDESEYDSSKKTLTDFRDNQIYKTVTIGNQTWMAENLNYAYVLKNVVDDTSSSCYKNEEEYCAKYGRLYTWAAAMDSAAMFSHTGEGCGNDKQCDVEGGVRGVCPSGWHLPSNNEWLTLFSDIGGIPSAGLKLKARSGWFYFNGKSKNGSDLFDFSVLPGIDDWGTSYFWTSTILLRSSDESFGVLFDDDDYVEIKSIWRKDKSSVRCVKDSDIDLKDKMFSDVSDVFPSTVENGVMIDDRDGQTYKTVTIGRQTWMAENLNYDYNERTAKSYCLNDEADSCAKYGRLYTWAAALDSAAVFSNAGKKCGYGYVCNPKRVVQGVCPSGWHLPSDTEWYILFIALNGGMPQTVGAESYKTKSGWKRYNGYDSYGFSVLPAGSRYGDGLFNDDSADFWSSTEINSEFGYGLSFGIAQWVNFNNLYKAHANSVRCIKDEN